MSVETYIFKGELDLLEKKQAELREVYKKLTSFILSDKFLRVKTEFENILASFEEKVVALVEVMETAPPIVVEAPHTPQPQQHAQQQVQAQQQPATITATAVFAKALLVAVAIFMVGIAEMKGYIPPESLNWVAVATVFLVSLPSILEAVKKFAERREKEEEVKPVSVDWVHRNLD
ncbi:MAG: hypothetical protein ACTSUS_05810 [Candidatus Freyarchaeota archaeon]